MKTTYEHYDAVQRVAPGSIITVTKATTARHNPSALGWAKIEVPFGSALRVIGTSHGDDYTLPSVRCLLPTEDGMVMVTFFGDQFNHLVINSSEVERLLHTSEIIMSYHIVVIT